MKRATPSEREIQRRSQYLAGQRSLPIVGITAPSVEQPALEQGNIKTGTSGKHIGRVLVWNLPTLRTCPGASDWCAANCYNGDTSGEVVFNRPQWYANERHAREDPDALGRTILRQLADEAEGATPPIVAVRVHSSGDFFSEPYVFMWRDIAHAAPRHLFWAYTRSWAIPELLPSLDTLRQMPNFQLFASVDHTMSDPPAGWRLSRVKDPRSSESEQGAAQGESRPKVRQIACPEEYRDGIDCAKCRFCLLPRKGDVIFNVH